MDTASLPPFGPALIGQTEKALDAILRRELSGTGATPTGWVLLKLAEGAGGRLGRRDMVERGVVEAKFEPAKVEAEVASLLSRGFLDDDGGEVVLTAEARRLQARVVGTTDEIRGRLWGDVPEPELATTGRVLGTVLLRANAELGYSI
ncbi:MAG TPA: hypothetical protein VGC32_00580 [Solirubrobacterales bacterium]